MNDELVVTVTDSGVSAGVKSSVDSGVPSEHIPLQSFLGVDIPTGAEKGKMASVWAYAKDSAKSEDEVDMMNAIRSLETRLGAPKLGQSRLELLHQYVELDRRARSYETARNELLR